MTVKVNKIKSLKKLLLRSLKDFKNLTGNFVTGN